MENAAEAIAGFLTGNVISTFSVRRVYDTDFYIIGERIYARATSQARMLAFSFGDCRDSEQFTVSLRAATQFFKEISTSEASVSANDHRGVSVDRREERKRRRKPSAVSGSLIIQLE